MADRFKKAKELFKAGKLEKAREWLETYIKGHPDDAQAFLNLSLIFDSLENSSESLKAQKRAFEIDPNCGLGFSKNSIIKGDRVLTDAEKIALQNAFDLVEKGK